MQSSSPAEPARTIVPLTVAQTYDLRRRVLRDATPSSDVTFAGDEQPDTFHLGVQSSGQIIATSTWTPAEFDYRPAATGYRLRGMAVDHTIQGSGAGGMLVAAGIAAVKRRGATFVWAHARLPALAFYRRHGFDTVGEQFIDLTTTGLPHQLIVIDL